MYNKMDDEEAFSRGGVRPPSNGALTPRQSKNTSLKKRKRPADVNEHDFNAKQPHFNMSVEILTYKKMHEGMLILGCVRKITTVYLEIELPGRVFGRLEVSNLSRAYINYLEESLKSNKINESADLKKLDSLYFVGQVIPTKVISIKRDVKTTVFLSTDPYDIYSTLEPSSYKAGTLLWAAVMSTLDHGYQLDIGKSNCRVFLHFDDVPENDKLEIGQTIWCVIKNSHTSCGIATFNVSAIPDEITNTVQNDTMIHNLLPGMQVSFEITNLLKNGLEGKLPNGALGYINELYLRQPLEPIKKYKVGGICEARVLYVEPLTNFVYLTFRRIDTYYTSVYPVGQNIPVTVLSKTTGGIYINLPNNEKGFVSDKRLIKTKYTIENFNKKFKPGSKHTAKILAYNVLEHLYICSLEDSVLKEMVFAPDNLIIGQQVKVVVSDFSKEGLIVKVGNMEGRVRGLIQNIHISDAEYKENFRNKFYVNQKLLVRVWNIDHRGVLFTNKDTFVKSDVYFTTYEEVEINKQYWGMVVFTEVNGDVVVVFYGGLKGYLPNPGTTYFKGQMVLVTVVEKNTNQLLLSLTPREVLKCKEIEVGEYHDVVVKGIEKNCLLVETKSVIKARLPAAHLSSTLSLSHMLLGTYKVGDSLHNLLCIQKKEFPILSLRESLYFRSSNLSIGTFNDIKVGAIVRGFYDSQNFNGINIFIPLKPIGLIQYVLYKDLTGSKKIVNYKFQFHQPIFLKVIEINKEMGTLKVTGRILEIYDKVEMLQRPIQHLEGYLHNYAKILANDNYNSLSTNLTIGKRVQCIVTKLDNFGCLVLINNGAIKGLVHRSLCPEDISIGQTLEGTILWIDIEKSCVHLVLLKNIVKKISESQDSNNIDNFNVTLNAKVLLVEKEFVISVLLTAASNNNLILLPTFIHENSFMYKIDNYSLLEHIKVIVCKKVEGFLVGLDKGHDRCVKRHLLNKDKTPVLRNLCKSSKNLSNTTTLVQPLTGNIYQNKELSNQKQHIFNRAQHKCIRSNKKQLNSISSTSLESGFSSMGTFFADTTLRTLNDGTPDDELLEICVSKLQKKHSATERLQLLKQNEEDLRKKELENCNLIGDPQNPDQFERLLVGTPNSSELWCKFIAYYVTQTEFEKARIIARRALNTISMNHSDDRLNIWIVWLNLENAHGNKASFENVFEEAVRSNDSLEIYLKVIQMLADSNKIEELEEKIKKYRNKFKTELRFWISLADIYYEKNMTKQANNLRDTAIKSIDNKLDQINLMIQFGIKEFKYGDKNAAEVLFETILEHNPKRIIVWNTYVDQLIKCGDLDKARRLYNRAIAQDLSIKKKRSVFNKYKEFEIRYGTKETLNKLMETIGQHLGIELQ